MRNVLLVGVTCFFLCLNAVLHAQPTRLIGDRIAYIDNVVQALSFTNDPDETRLFVVTQDGRILIVEDDEVLEEPFIDLGENGANIVDFGIGSEEGMLAMALDPDYSTNGYFYLTYNGWLPDGSGENVYDWHLLRFRRNISDPYQADPDWWEEILTIEMPRRGHNGGSTFFGNDGYLYVSCGDGGSTGTGAPGGGSNGDADNYAQSLNTLLGKMLRIDVSGEAPYTIPPDNPFVDLEDARGEIWSYGFRNPWRWSFDRETGDIYIGDVGEVNWEEISREPGDHPGGANYGWRLLEGPMCYEPVDDCDPENETVLPIHAYPHDGEVCSVIGGFVYRGDSIPSLEGYYIHSDACGFGEEKFWLLHSEGDEWVSNPVEVIVEGGFVPWQETRFGFGEDNSGNLYICTRLALYRIAEDPDYEAPIDDTTFEGLTLYPNPSRGEVTVDMGGNFELEELEVYDLNGRMVDLRVPRGSGLRYYTFDVSGLAAGVYIVTAKYAGFGVVRTAKLIVSNEDD